VSKPKKPLKKRFTQAAIQKCREAARMAVANAEPNPNPNDLWPGRSAFVAAARAVVDTFGMDTEALMANFGSHKWFFNNLDKEAGFPRKSTLATLDAFATRFDLKDLVPLPGTVVNGLNPAATEPRPAAPAIEPVPSPGPGDGSVIIQVPLHPDLERSLRGLADLIGSTPEAIIREAIDAALTNAKCAIGRP
jgi:hypothetical protein